jgi:hypothetical protein
MLVMDQCPGLAMRAFETIVPCAPEIHCAKRSGGALAEFKASKTLVRAREAVRYDPSPATLKALQQAEAGWERAMDKIAERAGRTKGPDTRR